MVELGAEKSGGGGSPPQRTGSGLEWESPDFALLSDECLSAAEEAAQKVVNCVRPTLDSEEKRRDMIDYVQRLIKTHLNCEVFPYGSVPLKTYLPDGDIDLTAFEGLNPEESVALGVWNVLEGEQKNENAEFRVMESRFINAEVKIVKCIVRTTVIDISFNQLGGLATLCFLEQVDRLIGRKHLFKRSIILVKSWCYYESRILGAHHGLISTYALETLVLYIFHLFHSSLTGPLAVLYRFLVYYSQFDWENYCISMKGPVCKSSLPDIVVEMPESGWNNLLLSEQFMVNCMEMFSSSRMVEATPKLFQPKYLNIVDPLKENNNLGRSVTKANFYRIRSAFKYGAYKLGQTLLQPRDKVADEISRFFVNTLTRHQSDNTSSIQCLTDFGNEESLSVSVPSPAELISVDDGHVKSSISDVDRDSVRMDSKNDTDRYLMHEHYLEASSSDSGGVVASQDLATSDSSQRKGASDFEACSDYDKILSWDRSCKSSSFASQTRSLEKGDSCQNNLVDNSYRKFGLDSLSLDTTGCGEVNNNCQQYMDNSQAVSKARSDSSIAKANFSDNSSPDFWEADFKSIGGESESFNPLADLSGDYDDHIRSLLYGQLCLGYPSPLSYHHPPSASTQFESNNPSYDAAPQWIPSQGSETSSFSQSGVSRKHPVADSTCHSEETRNLHTNSRNSNRFPQESSSRGRGRNKARGNRNQPRRYPSAGEDKPNYFQNDNHRPKGSGKWNPSLQSPHLEGNRSSNSSSSNRDQTASDQSALNKIQFGTIGNLADELISSTARDEGSSRDIKQDKEEAVMTPKRSIHIKNEAEFPPLRQENQRKDGTK
ncbi:uncharacterized protein LOC127253732 isoform X2 [Andrographis paniculata]|uniref:uncharacterized protein LOC127253732 isoform X2 n=1 Tax=Andrographis paniculata TaxID=175694 RepID=UPI0021E77B48|nr:uncharacterized protein LOC127253732 isoform X2 [Andrographis paniculata]